MSTPEIHGFCDEQFAPLKEAFIANFDAGLELGASLALTHQGKPVVDLWAGWADPQRTRPWEKDTIVNIASTTKIATIFCLLTLIDRGLVDLDSPVARHWPEFAAGGKAAVTVREAMTHQAGVPAFVPVLTHDDLYDWDKVVANLAAQPYWFGDKRTVCYGPVSYGFLLGEIVRRVDGRRPAKFFREEIIATLGADFQIAVAAEHDLKRAAEFKLGESLLPPPEDTLMEYIVASVAPTFGGDGSFRSMSWENPSGSGYANGRSIARVCAVLAMKGALDGVRYLSEGMVAEAAREQVFADDPYMGPVKYGLGFGLHSALFRAVSETSFHWGGYGGSWGVMDPAAGVSLGYAPNNWSLELTVTDMDPRQQRFSDALKKVLPAL